MDKNIETSTKKNTKKNAKPLSRREKQLAAEAMEYFIQYVSSPWRIVWVNFLAGNIQRLGGINRSINRTSFTHLDTDITDRCSASW